jgi:DNA-binding NarL/FixJ family response regulator
VPCSTARAAPVAPPAGLAELTAREHEVLGLIAAGLSNHEIAAALHLSPLTAKTHVSRILRRLDARDRIQLVVMAYQTGIVVERPRPRSEWRT